jgi:hypothetical protein
VIKPLPIKSAATLAYFMEREIARLDQAKAYPTLFSRTSLISELASSLDLDSESIITPLLVTMYVELVLKSRPASEDAKTTPYRTTTGLYLNYFTFLLNSRLPIDHDEALLVGGQLGKLAIDGTYIPSAFSKLEGKSVLAKLNAASADTVLAALIASGLLSESDEPRVGMTEIRFTIDMLAEVLGAYQLIIDNGKSDSWYVALEKKIESEHPEALDFLRTLRTVRLANPKVRPSLSEESKDRW